MLRVLATTRRTGLVNPNKDAELLQLLSTVSCPVTLHCLVEQLAEDKVVLVVVRSRVCIKSLKEEPEVSVPNLAIRLGFRRQVQEQLPDSVAAPRVVAELQAWAASKNHYLDTIKVGGQAGNSGVAGQWWGNESPFIVCSQSC